MDTVGILAPTVTTAATVLGMCICKQEYTSKYSPKIILKVLFLLSKDWLSCKIGELSETMLLLKDIF